MWDEVGTEAWVVVEKGSRRMELLFLDEPRCLGD